MVWRLRIGALLVAIMGIGLIIHPARAQFLDRFISPGPLARPHERYEGVKNCTYCHTVGSKAYDDKCLNCHTEIKRLLDKRLGYHGDQSKCETCHSDHKGKTFQMIDLKDFDHIDTGYPLYGRHAEAKCKDCHKGFRLDAETKKRTRAITYLDAPKNCYDCHQEDYTHDLSAKYKQSCKLCHDDSEREFKKLRRYIMFDHNTTRYKLTGLHQTTACVKCHKFKNPKARRFKELRFTSCENCHADVHKGSLGKDCESCHETTINLAATPPIETKAEVKETKEATAPKPAVAAKAKRKAKQTSDKFDHDDTAYPLRGLHEGLECQTCHPNARGGTYKVAKFQSCADCHRDPHGNQLKNYACSSCHPEDKKWEDSTFGIQAHNQKSPYKLDGAHAALSCYACHLDGTYKPLGYKTCEQCHRNPHPADQLQTARAKYSCDNCHTTASFSKSIFDHGKSRFKLDGKHKKTNCYKCHVNQEFARLPMKCQECHRDPHGKSIEDTCDQCHSTESFPDVRGFRHEAYSAWPLDGGHGRLRCIKCHPNHLQGRYELGAKTCVSCHSDIHNNTNGQSCDRCHLTETWETGRRVKEHDLGYFEIGGMHDKLPCYRCHADTSRRKQGSGMVCISCHKMADVHRGALGGDCEECHRQDTWVPAIFDHNRTPFELSGAHRHLDCKDCHRNNMYAGIPEDCLFCHQKSFVPTLPGHLDQSDVMMCNRCHGTLTWKK